MLDNDPEQSFCFIFIFLIVNSIQMSDLNADIFPTHHTYIGSTHKIEGLKLLWTKIVKCSEQANVITFYAFLLMLV